VSVLGAVDLFALPLSCYLVVVIYSDSPFVTMSITRKLFLAITKVLPVGCVELSLYVYCTSTSVCG
jgi:hypothetical protein